MYPTIPEIPMHLVCMSFVDSQYPKQITGLMAASAHKLVPISVAGFCEVPVLGMGVGMGWGDGFMTE